MTIRSDVVIKTKKDETCVQIDVAIQSHRNVIQKGTENKLKIGTINIEVFKSNECGIWNALLCW